MMKRNNYQQLSGKAEREGGSEREKGKRIRLFKKQGEFLNYATLFATESSQRRLTKIVSKTHMEEERSFIGHA